MDETTVLDIEEKLGRVRRLLKARAAEALVIGRKDNFAWVTCGGNDEIVIPSESGVALLVITQDSVRLVAQVMDGPRILEEELKGLEVEYTPLHWFEPSPVVKVAEFVQGAKAIADVPITGAFQDPASVWALHYPLTQKEIDRLRWLGRATERILGSVIDSIRPGDTETEIKGRLLGEYGREGIRCDVILIGSDDRVSRYRHPYPSDRRINRYAVVHPAVQKWGLHANITRSVHFGPIPRDILESYRVACRVEAAAVGMSRPGVRFAEIAEAQKRLYEESGRSGEWKKHFMGGVTGYLLADPTLALDPHAMLSVNQAYDWFITITGVKVEELSLSTVEGCEICSVTGLWPTEKHAFGDQVFDLPVIKSV